jgi:hypothetical protein
LRVSVDIKNMQSICVAGRFFQAKRDTTKRDAKNKDASKYASTSTKQKQKINLRFEHGVAPSALKFVATSARCCCRSTIGSSRC